MRCTFLKLFFKIKMKASLIFLDSPTESAIGMIRGIIAFLALVLSFWILRAAVERNSNEILPRGWCVTFIALAMCSLIGISKPDSEKNRVYSRNWLWLGCFCFGIRFCKFKFFID